MNIEEAYELAQDAYKKPKSLGDIVMYVETNVRKLYRPGKITKHLLELNDEVHFLINTYYPEKNMRSITVTDVQDYLTIQNLEAPNI